MLRSDPARPLRRSFAQSVDHRSELYRRFEVRHQFRRNVGLHTPVFEFRPFRAFRTSSTELAESANFNPLHLYLMSEPYCRGRSRSSTSEWFSLLKVASSFLWPEFGRPNACGVSQDSAATLGGICSVRPGAVDTLNDRPPALGLQELQHRLSRCLHLLWAEIRTLACLY